MKEKLRGFLGFLGLVEDEYSEYGPSNAPRPFSESPEEFEPEWTATPSPAARVISSQPASPSPFRTTGTTTTKRTNGVSVLEGPHGVSRVRPMANPNGARVGTAFNQDRDVAVVSPETYDDSRRITDLLRSNRAVVLSTLDVDATLARRLVDFTAGTAYALNAKIEMLIRGVYLISPYGLHLGPEMKERLRAANYRAFEQA